MLTDSPSRLGGLAVVAALALWLGGCATSPTGRSQLLVIPPEQLDPIGVQAFAQMREEMKESKDPQVRNYVRCIADAITAELSEPTYDWEVAVFEDESPNAFALPGGKIGVHTGLLEVAENQDQLAAVMGHEVGHVLAHHAAERASQQQLTSIGLSVVGATGQLNAGWMQVLGLGAQVGLLLPYSRVHESEADIIGLDLMAQAGFDPRASVDLWRNMMAQGGGKPPEFLSTHPAGETRITNLRSRMSEALRTYESARARGKKPSCG